VLPQSIHKVGIVGKGFGVVGRQTWPVAVAVGREGLVVVLRGGVVVPGRELVVLPGAFVDASCA
jgi:hypothetical protein